MQSNASTVAEYLKSLPPQRREALFSVRKEEIVKHLPKGYRKVMQ